MKVYKEPCKNCLLSPDSIVSPARRRDIINGCVRNQTHFICHKATINKEDVCCSTFYERLGQHSNLIRVMERLNGIEFIDQPEQEKFPTYSEMKRK